MDTYVNLPRLYKELKSDLKPKEGLYWGYFTGMSRVVRDPRKREGEPKYVMCNSYLPYAFGGGTRHKCFGQYFNKPK